MAFSNQNDDGDLYGAPRPLSEINVTPLVDVMLVLLIVFMVSAPLLQQGVQVDLPKTNSKPLADQKKQFVLVVKKNGSIEINNNSVPLKNLREKLQEIFKNIEAKEIFVQADQNVRYGLVADVMSQIQMAGISRIGLVTEPKK